MPTQLVAVEVEAGEAGQRRTAAGAGRATSRLPSRCRRSVQIGSWWRHADRLVPLGRRPGRPAAAAQHPLRRSRRYGSPHDGRERVAQHPPVARVAQRAVADADPLALEGVARSRSAARRCDRQPELARRSARRSAGRAPAGWTPGSVTSRPASACGRRLGHLLAGVGEPEARAAGRRGSWSGCPPRRAAAGARRSCVAHRAGLARPRPRRGRAAARRRRLQRVVVDARPRRTRPRTRDGGR